MRDWNVVATAHEDGYKEVRKLLAGFGPTGTTEFYNVLVMKVADPTVLLEELGEMVAESPGLMNDLSRVVPAEEAFTFQSVAEFEDAACAIALRWVPRLAGQSFHVRLNRRGFKGRLSTQDEERFLDDVLLHRLSERGTPGRIDFEDPDAVIDIETVGGRAGMSLWTREELRRFPFLHVD
jgi:tRNA(Ser,Leu) C12 N-acetylase TAN1